LPVLIVPRDGQAELAWVAGYIEDGHRFEACHPSDDKPDSTLQ